MNTFRAVGQAHTTRVPQASTPLLLMGGIESEEPFSKKSDILWVSKGMQVQNNQKEGVFDVVFHGCGFDIICSSYKCELEGCFAYLCND